MSIAVTSNTNSLIASLPKEAVQALDPRLELIDLPKGFVVNESQQITEYTYFPTSGIVSLLICGDLGQTTHIGLFGREGCGPPTVIVGTLRVPYRSIVEVAGQGYRIANTQLAAVIADNLEARTTFTRYVQVQSVQIAYGAHTAVTYTIPKRLARLLLMHHDRINDNEILLTHQRMASMLGSRRQSVTSALHLLEYKGLIGSRRNSVLITDRSGLENMAGDAYGAPEREYDRLIGPQFIELSAQLATKA